MSYVCYLCLVMYSTVKYYMSNRKAVTAYPSEPPGFTPRFLLGPLLGSEFLIFLFFCVVFFVLFVFVLCRVHMHPMLPFFLDCPFLIAPSAFFNV